MKYAVEMLSDYSWFDKESGIMHADFYCIEGATSNEYCGTVYGTDVLDGEIANFGIQFKDWHTEKAVSQEYNKELFEAIKEQAMIRFIELMEIPEVASGG